MESLMNGTIRSAIRRGGALLVVVLICHCLAARADEIQVRQSRDHFNPNWWVIFTAEQAAGLWERDGTEFWTPTERDVRAFEPLLAPRLAELRHRAGRNGPRPGDYYRQYVGVVERGKRVLILHGLHRLLIEDAMAEVKARPCTVYGSEPEPKEQMCPPIPGKPRDFWKREWVGVSDGGCSVIHASFDVEALRVTNVWCNGTA